MAGFVFGIFGMVASVYPSAMRRIQLALRQALPFGERMPAGDWMRSDRYLSFTRFLGFSLLAFGLFCFYWHFAHC